MGKPRQDLERPGFMRKRLVLDEKSLVRGNADAPSLFEEANLMG